jgi:TonB family protein
MPQQFKKYLLWSAAMHVIVFVLVWWSPSLNLIHERPYKVTWIQLSKGDGGTNPLANFKNSKSLPQSSIREQNAAKRQQFKDKEGTDLASQDSQNKNTTDQMASQKRTSPDGSINPNATKKTASKDRTADALARIEQQLEQREVDMSAAQAKEGDAGQSPYGSLHGSNVDPEWIQYYNTIKRKINSQWVIAKGDVSGALVAKIVVMIDANGNVMRSRFEAPSGDGSFDESAIRAINKAAPFPTPPAGLRAEVLTEGFLFEFNPSSVTGNFSGRF